MAPPGESSFTARTRTRVRGWSADRRAVVGVALVVFVGLVLRLVALGSRVAHWDESRVAYWALRYAQSGVYEYRYITHGPFLHLINGDVVFPIFGPSDASARLVVALVGAGLPAAALLFRRHLDPVETVGMAAFLAGTPVLLYYSRFMRNDLLLAAFMLVAAGCFLRAAETGRPGFLYAGSLFAGLGFTTKENAVVYLVVWLGAAVLVADHALYRAAGGTDGFGRIAGLGEALRARYAADPAGTRRRATRVLAHGLGAVLVFLAVVVIFYYPRDPDQIGLLGALVRPSALPGVVEAGLLHPIEEAAAWVGQADDPESLSDRYMVPLEGMVDTMVGGAAGLTALSVVGFVLERYRAGTRRLVMFAAYWGFASVLGYPLAASVQYPAWLTVHALVPLSIPAAVGLGWLVRHAAAAVRERDLAVLAVFGAILVLVVGNVAVTAAGTVYANPQSHDNPMVQYAQPASPELRGVVEDIERASAEDSGVDVLYYGELFHMDDEADAEQTPVEGGGWFARLPLPWYTLSVDATTESVEGPDRLADALAEEPPVVVAEASEREALDPHLSEYRSGEYDLFSPGARTVVVYVDETRT